jgi:DNA-binding Lrp family transcriptional regulator
MAYEDLDRRLLNALLSDGRASQRGLAEEVDVSVTAVSNHLEDLEDDVITGYEPRLNYDALGYDVTAVVQLRVRGDALPAIADRLAEEPQMVSVYEVTGDHDVVAVGRFVDTDDMNRHIKALLTDPAVEATNTNVVLNAITEFEQFDLPVEDE